MPEGHWKRLATSSALLAAMVLVAGVVLALIGSTVFPQAALFAWAAVVLLLFLLFQLLVFRLLGLRSRADELPAPPAAVRPAGPATPPRASHDTAAHDPDPHAAAEHADARPAGHEAGVQGDATGGPGEEAGAAGDADRDWRAWRG